MFSKDINCYRKTARTMNEAFGPYSGLGAIPTRRASLGKWACYAVAVLSIVAATVALSGCDEAQPSVAGKDGCTVIYTYYGADRQFVRCGGRGAVVPRMDGKIGKKPVTLVTAR
ncbi:hypothetical protein [Ralstonia phage p2110]|nr:hypothetical protein [Ralstonia phage p2110]